MTPLLAAFSILDPIYGAMGRVLAFFFSVVASYGVSIALLTITVRIFLIPLTTKQVKSQQAMQRIQPELKRLQAKYKNDREKLNKEMMSFYKENKVNPLAGCLPILLQAPLFIVLYRLILDLSDKDGPKHIPESTNLFSSLVASGGEMASLGMDLAKSASSVSGFGSAFPYYILVALTVLTGYFQQRQMTARMPKDGINAQMQMIGKVFPAIIGVISLSVPAGVVVYFIVSNIWQIGQQAIMFRAFPPPHTVAGAAKAEKAGTGSSKSSSGSAASKSAASKSAASKSAAKPGQKGRSGSERPGKSTPAARSGRAQPPKGAKPQGKGGRRPPPSPRPKGLPAPGRPSSSPPGGQAGSNGTSAKDSRRKER